MTNYVEDEPSHVNRLVRLSAAIMEYHEECARIMRAMNTQLHTELQKAQQLPRTERKPLTQLESNLNKSLESFDVLDEAGNSTSISVQASSAQASSAEVSSAQPSAGGEFCRALYDFVAENPGDLAFHAGDMIEIVERVDENWWRGKHCSFMTEGLFPATYVEMA